MGGIIEPPPAEAVQYLRSLRKYIHLYAKLQ